MNPKLLLLFLGLLILGGCASFQKQEVQSTLAITPASSPQVVDEVISLKRKVAIARFTNMAIHWPDARVNDIELDLPVGVVAEGITGLAHVTRVSEVDG